MDFVHGLGCIPLYQSTLRISIMGKALAQLFALFTTAFGSIEKLFVTLDNVAQVGVEYSELYVDQSRHVRAIQRAELDKEIASIAETTSKKVIAA
jgi:hypothetical protein